MGKIDEEPKLEVVKEEQPKTEEKKGPSPEEVEQYKLEFQEAVKKFENTKWQVSEPGRFGSNDVGLFLLEFIEKYAFWSKTEWMGMLKMREEIKKSMGMADDEVGLRFGYQALEFCAYMLSNPGGTGIELAEQFEAQADKYAKIGMIIGAAINVARKELKEMQYLQERWAAGEQGFYYEREPEQVDPDKPKEEGEIVALTEEELKTELETNLPV